MVAIGNFDGVHKGHQAVLAKAAKKAEALNLPLVALTFDPHPKEVLLPEKVPLRLTPFEEKTDLLSRYGADVVYVVPFSQAYAQTTAQRFIEQTLAGALRAAHVVVGADFAFGRHREGDVQTLEEAGQAHGFTVDALTLEGAGEEAYSSTAIRQAIAAGDRKKARQMLGHDIARLKETDK